MTWRQIIGVRLVLVFAVLGGAGLASAADSTLAPHHNPPDLNAVPTSEWDAIDRAVSAGLLHLQRKQLADGAFDTRDSGKPAVASLCVMAYLSAGHRPGHGPYGETINRAIDFVLSTQQEEGLFTYLAPDVPVNEWDGPTHTATYNHAICGLMLGEVYGLTDPQRGKKVQLAIEKALVWGREHQSHRVPRQYRMDQGGWRYLRVVPGRGYSDLSVTSWYIMFLRSANNAGFHVPKQWITEGVDYVERCFDRRTGGFKYALWGQPRITRGTTGAGILSLFLSGQYDAKIERASGDWMLRHDFKRFNRSPMEHDRYYYACYYCSQAAFQLGDRYWAKIYRPLAQTLATNQRPDGGWMPSHLNPGYKTTYSTSLAILALTPPYQLLPIYQR